MGSAKSASAYQVQKLESRQKEYPCGMMHASLEEAMVHAEANLRFRNERGDLVVKVEPLLGGTRFSGGTVIGWQSGPKRRFRVDFDPDFAAANAKAAKRKDGVHKGKQGVHVNEEDFTRRGRQKVCHPTESSLLIADLLWKRWSSRYGRRGQITKEHITTVDG